jgi:hypothetical protein
MLNSVLNYLTQIAAMPRPVWAVIGGLLISWAITLRVKFWVPAKWSAHSREVSVQALGFVSAFLSTYLLWATSTVDALIAALIVGLLSPALWNILMLVIGWWKPGLRDALSQNVRISP